MTLDVLPTVKSAGRKRSDSWIGPRMLLLFSCLLVMMFARDAPGHTAPRLAALLVATLSTGVALLRPLAVRDVDRLRRAEWALVIVLLPAGLLLTAGVTARAFADLVSPLWFAAIAAYTIVGLAGALSLGLRWPPLKWAFVIFLVAHTAMTVALMHTSPVSMDVQIYLHDGVVALLHGHNPYAMTIPNIYSPELTEHVYGPGVVVDGRVTSGFPYPPVALLVAIPGQLLGDVRYSQLIAMLVTALVLRRLAVDPVGRAAAVLGVASVSAIPMLTGAWTEPTIVALLACLVLALERRRHAFVAVLLGLFLVSKQYLVVAVPILWLIRQSLTRRLMFIAIGVATAVTLPFFLVDPAAFWKAIVEIQLVQPFRSESVSLLVFSVNSFGWPPPWTYGVLPLMGGGLTAIALALRAPRTPSAFAASFGLTLLVTILLSKQAFMNYYFLVSGAFLIAAVAWPSLPGPTPPGPTPPEAASGRLDSLR